MMCRHQQNTVFLMGLPPDYCAHCEVERLRKDAARWRYVKEMCYSTEVNERDYVGIMFRESAHYAQSTSQTFENAVDAAMDRRLPIDSRSNEQKGSQLGE